MIGIVPHVGAENGEEFLHAQTVVFDILRATTTMAVAFEGGAKEVIPAPSIEAARRLKAEFPQAILGGEENLEPPPGFEFGNSPAQYSKAALRGRSLILATTNGTRALHGARRSEILLAASFRNLAATVAALDPEKPVILFPAGVEGRTAAEDTLAAGAVAAALTDRGASPSPEAREAMRLWHAHGQDLTGYLLATPNGRRLAEHGHEADVRMAGGRDTCPVAIAVSAGRALPLP